MKREITIIEQHVDLMSLKLNQLDVIFRQILKAYFCLQEEAETLLYPYAEDYLKYVRDRVIVTIKRIEKSQVFSPSLFS